MTVDFLDLGDILDPDFLDIRFFLEQLAYYFVEVLVGGPPSISEEKL